MRIAEDLAFIGAECGKTQLICRDETVARVAVAGVGDPGWFLETGISDAGYNLNRQIFALRVVHHHLRYSFAHLALRAHFLDLRGLLFKPSVHRLQLVL
jgi:hypothetical protein